MGELYHIGDPIRLNNREMFRLISSMVDLDPKKRPSPMELYHDSWFDDVRKYLEPIDERIEPRDCYHNLTSEQVRLPIRGVEIENFGNLYHQFLQGPQAEWNINDRVTGVIISMFEANIHRFHSGTAKQKYPIYFRAILSLATQIFYSNDVELEKQIHDEAIRFLSGIFNINLNGSQRDLITDG